MAKNFTNSLSSLVGKKPETETKPEEETGAATGEAPESTPEGNLLSTIEDATLRAKLQARQTKDRGRHKKGEVFTSSTEGWSKICLTMKEETIQKIRLISLKDSLQIKETVEALLSVAIKKYEEKYGEVKPMEIKAPESNLSKFENL